MTKLAEAVQRVQLKIDNKKEQQKLEQEKEEEEEKSEAESEEEVQVPELLQKVEGNNLQLKFLFLSWPTLKKAWRTLCVRKNKPRLGLNFFRKWAQMGAGKRLKSWRSKWKSINVFS